MRTGYASHNTPRIAFWVALVAVIGMGDALCPSPYVHATETTSPEGVVQQYYAALNRRDVEAARGQWKTPPSRLQDMVQQVEWYRVEDSTLLQEDASAAQVKVMVTGKRLNQQPEQWSGTVKLEKIAGAWKIVTMPLTQHTSAVNTPRPPDVPTPGLPAQPQAAGASSMTKGARPPAAAPNWSLKQIPFGQPRSKVLEQFVGAKVLPDEKNWFILGGFDATAKDFQGGIYTDFLGAGRYLSPQFVTKYDVSHTGWADIETISLYFVGNKSSTEDRLFLVIKEFRLETVKGSPATAFTGAKEAISRLVGTEPTTFSERYKLLGSPTDTATALIARWNTDTVNLYYVLRDWHGVITSPPPTIAYIDKEGWKRYISMAEAATEAKQREQRNKAGTAIERNF